MQAGVTTFGVHAHQKGNHDRPTSKPEDNAHGAH